MKKVDIAEKIAKTINIDNEVASLMVGDLLREISRHVDDLRQVSIRGFGSFGPKVYCAKSDTKLFTASYSSTNKSVFSRLRFKPGIRLKQQIRESVSLDKDTKI